MHQSIAPPKGEYTPFIGEAVGESPPEWIDLWSFGRYNLQLSEDEFWVLTLREFIALSERYKDSQDWLDYRAALICSVMANLWSDTRKRKKPYSPSDFMPEGRKERSVQQTPEQMFTIVKMLNAAYGGRVQE